MTLALTPTSFAVVMVVDFAIGVGIGAVLGAIARRVAVVQRPWVEATLGLAAFFGVGNALGLVGMVAFGGLATFPHLDLASPPLLFGSALGLAAGNLLLVTAAAVRGTLALGGWPGWRWLAVGTVSAGAAILASAGWGTLLAALGVEPESQAVLQALERGAPWSRAVLIVFVAVWAPLVEELVFRGWLLPRLAAVLSPRWAVAAQAAVFAALHLDRLWAVPPLVVIGLTAGWLRHRSGSVLPGMAFHLGNNGLALAVALAA